MPTLTSTLEAPLTLTPPPAKKATTAGFKVVPETREMRDKVKDAAHAYCLSLDKTKPLSKDGTREAGEEILRGLGYGDEYLGFTMVMITNEFWRDQVAAIPFNRRLMLVPHCLKNAEGCPADYDEFGLDCRKCGQCSVADFKTKAEDLGYKVLVSEGTPIVLKIIVSGHVDAIVGVACLNVLEKAFDKILLAGIPCVATPLLSSNCKNTSVDNDWVFDMIGLQTAAPTKATKSYVHLMRAANDCFEEPAISHLAPRRGATPATGIESIADPLLKHEAIAYDFLTRGGKRSRPFIVLAAYDALTGGKGRESIEGVALPDALKRAALAIEAFHKASLVHDDIQDDDAYRYGMETLHRVHGIGPAINLGDYLIGLGYRLVSRDRKTSGSEVAADILDKLADSHLKLSEGQGAELLWRTATNKALTPTDALKIYALKTSPAFEAALYSGARMAGPVDAIEKSLTDYARNVGVAFQILNDLKDWNGDEDNKLVAGQDVLSARPTLLLALALEAAGPADKADLLAMLNNATGNADVRMQRVRAIYRKTKVFEKADKLVEKFKAKAESIADQMEPLELRELMYYLVDTVLEHVALPAEPAPVELGLLTIGMPSRAAS